jgi:transposase-like protein
MLVVPAPHPVEFRRRAVELARLGEQPIAVIAKQPSISESCLRNWLVQADTDAGRGETRLTTDEKKELRLHPQFSVLPFHFAQSRPFAHRQRFRLRPDASSDSGPPSSPACPS